MPAALAGTVVEGMKVPSLIGQAVLLAVRIGTANAILHDIRA